MKRLLLALGALSLAANVHAATADSVTLRNYAIKALQRCPDAVVTLEPVAQAGPTNFRLYTLEMTSSDSACGTSKYLLYSPTTQQVVLGAVFALPADNRPTNVRVASHASGLVKQSLTATIAPFPLPDGLKSVAMTRQTPHGPFSYNGFVDASERFLIVGTRGNLQQDPGKTLVEALSAGGAVRRGNAKSKVQIVELSDFQCPTCARAHKKIEPIIQKNLDKISYTRIDLPLFEHHEWAVDAAAAARAINRVAPAKYWKYVDDVFTNQEAISKQPFEKFLQGWIEDNDIDWKKIEPLYRSKTERAAIMEQVSRAFDNGLNSTPTFIINGQAVGFGPEGTFTVNEIRKAMGLAPEPAAKPAAAKK